MNILVIGGTRGFGASLTGELRTAGCNVITVGRSVGNYYCDVSDGRAWSEAIEQIVREHEAFDLLVCVVGYARAKPSAELTEADWTAHASANLWYVEQAIACIPHRRFVTTGSQWSYRIGDDALVPYIQAKHALRELTLRLGGMHYCVPPMDTPQRREVWIDGGSAVPVADAHTIATAMGRHLCIHQTSGVYIINNKGAVTPLPS